MSAPDKLLRLIGSEAPSLPGYAFAEDLFNNPETGYLVAGNPNLTEAALHSFEIKKLAALNGVALTAEQKAGMDASPVSSTDPVAAISDLNNIASSQSVKYTFRTATDAPLEGEIKLDNADASLATFVNVHKTGFAGASFGNVISRLRLGDALLLQDMNEPDKVYNFDVSGTPVDQTTYYAVPVTFYSKGDDLTDEDGVISVMMYSASSSTFLLKTENLDDLQNKATARTNLDVYQKAEVYSKTEADGITDSKLAITSNLSDLDNVATARTNLSVSSTTEANGLYLAKTSNLSDLGSIATARTNLDVYSKAETASVAASVARAAGSTVVTDSSYTVSGSVTGILAHAIGAGLDLAVEFNAQVVVNNGGSNALANVMYKGVFYGRTGGNDFVGGWNASWFDSTMAQQAYADTKTQASGVDDYATLISWSGTVCYASMHYSGGFIFVNIYGTGTGSILLQPSCLTISAV